MSDPDHSTGGAARFTKLDHRLIDLGLPLRLVALYGLLDYRAGNDGIVDPLKWPLSRLAQELHLKDQKWLGRLLARLRELKLIEWTRKGRSYEYRVLPPDLTWIADFLTQHRQIRKVAAKPPIGAIGKVAAKPPIGWPQSHLSDPALKSVGNLLEEEEEEHTPPTPHAPPSPKPVSEPGACATAVARVGDSSLAKIRNSTVANSGNAHPRDCQTVPFGDWFAAWWAIYWRKESKKAAATAFRFHVKTPERFAQVMTATKAQTTAMLARAPDKRPCGDSWLKGERWNDEASAPAKPVAHEGRSLKASVMRVIGARLAKGEKPW